MDKVAHPAVESRPVEKRPVEKRPVENKVVARVAVRVAADRTAVADRKEAAEAVQVQVATANTTSRSWASSSELALVL